MYLGTEASYNKTTVRFEFYGLKSPKNMFYIKNINVKKVDIFVVKVVISQLRSLRSKNGCQIWIQRVEKHAKVSLSRKKFFSP